MVFYKKEKEIPVVIRHSIIQQAKVWSVGFIAVFHTENQAGIFNADTDVRHLVKRTNMLQYDLLGNVVQQKKGKLFGCRIDNWFECTS